jgi:hypothetical protein
MKKWGGQELNHKLDFMSNVPFFALPFAKNEANGLEAHEETCCGVT